MGTKSKKDLGRWGEGIAIDWLKGQGLDFLERNYRTPYGEIDLIMKDEVQIIFVEVKTRANLNFGYPESAVNEKKIHHIESSAIYYFQHHPDYLDNWRIDVLSIVLAPHSISPEIVWFKNVHS